MRPQASSPTSYAQSTRSARASKTICKTDVRPAARALEPMPSPSDRLGGPDPRAFASRVLDGWPRFLRQLEGRGATPGWPPSRHRARCLDTSSGPLRRPYACASKEFLCAAVGHTASRSVSSAGPRARAHRSRRGVARASMAVPQCAARRGGEPGEALHRGQQPAGCLPKTGGSLKPVPAQAPSPPAEPPSPSSAPFREAPSPAQGRQTCAGIGPTTPWYLHTHIRNLPDKSLHYILCKLSGRCLGPGFR